jgi:L-ribulokinase
MNVPMKDNESYVIGVDYGTLSGRAVVVRVRDGKELGSAVHEYPHAVVTDSLPKDVAGAAADGQAVRLPGEWALQVPNDYRDVLGKAVPAAVADAGIDPARFRSQRNNVTTDAGKQPLLQPLPRPF